MDMNQETQRRIAYTGKLIAAILCLGMLPFIQSCNDDDDDAPALTTLAGVYQFSNVTLAEPVTLPFTIPGLPNPLPAGEPVTDQLVDALYALSDCSDPSVLSIILKSNKQLFFGCTNSSSEVPAGTWDELADLTSLTLNLLIPNPDNPSTPNQLSLVVQNIETTATTIKGRINGFPLNSFGGIPLDPPLVLSLNVEFGRVP